MQLLNRIQTFLKALAGEENVTDTEQVADETERLANKVALRFQNGLYRHSIKIDGLSQSYPYLVCFDIFNNDKTPITDKATLKSILLDNEFVASGRLQSSTNYWLISSIGASGTFYYVRILRTTLADTSTNSILGDSDTATITDIVNQIL